MKLTGWLIGIVGVFIVGGMMIFVAQTLEPRPVRILNPSYFENGSALGQALAERFYTDARDKKTFVLGVSPHLESADEVWASFLGRLAELGVQWDITYRYGDVQGAPASAVSIQSLAEVPSHSENVRTLIFVPSTEAMWNEIQDKLQSNDFVFFQVPYSNIPEEAENIPLKCEEGKKGLQFGCAAIAASRRYYRKKLTERRYTAMMEKQAQRLFLLLISEPRP